MVMSFIKKNYKKYKQSVERAENRISKDILKFSADVRRIQKEQSQYLVEGRKEEATLSALLKLLHERRQLRLNIEVFENLNGAYHNYQEKLINAAANSQRYAENASRSDLDSFNAARQGMKAQVKVFEGQMIMFQKLHTDFVLLRNNTVEIIQNSEKIYKEANSKISEELKFANQYRKELNDSKTYLKDQNDEIKDMIAEMKDMEDALTEELEEFRKEEKNFK